MSNIDISVIVPIYNVEQYIKECLDSLATQKMDSIEVLMVNDGTKDKAGEIAKEYAEKYPDRFRYFEKENGGLSDARNYAFPYVRGKYVAFVDSDDYVADDMYEQMWRVVQQFPEVDIVECELEKVFSDHMERIRLPQKYDNVSDYMLNARVCAWNKLYRVQWLKENQVDFPTGLLYEDVCFFCKIVPCLNVMPITIHLPLYYYRQRKGSILSNSTHRILEIHDVFEEIFSFYTSRNMPNKYIECAEYKYIKTVFCSFLLRMLKMEDREIRNEVINVSWKKINAIRPYWRKNCYLKKISPRNIYIRLMSKPLLVLMKFFVK